MIGAGADQQTAAGLDHIIRRYRDHTPTYVGIRRSEAPKEQYMYIDHLVLSISQLDYDSPTSYDDFS